MQNINWSDLLFIAFNEKSRLVLHVAACVTILPDTGDNTGGATVGADDCA